MAFLQLYKNKFTYPQFTNTLIKYGSLMECTPVGINLRTGTIRVKGSFSDFMACNYMALTRDGKTIYAWIDDVAFLNDEAFTITYSVDAWRTYKESVTLGDQFIKRSPKETVLKDPLLGSTNPFVNIDSTMYFWPWASSRVMIVQVRTKGASIYSNAPVQPTPYLFFACRYDVDDWQSSKPLNDLITALANNAETTNLVTMYSIPFMDLADLGEAPLIIQTPDATLPEIFGWKLIGSEIVTPNLSQEIAIDNTGWDDLMAVDHSLQIVIPDAGIINIPDELAIRTDLKLRQDVDIFSGASNYMLMSGAGKFYDLSVRGSGISSIPIISDPYDTYISQNQNALTTSIIGDVATIAVGAGIVAGTGGLAALAGAGGAALGGAGIATGARGLLSTWSDVNTAKTAAYANPPAFLGTAMANNFNQTFWVVTRNTKVTNAAKVHANFGYPYNLVDALTFPSAGYIQTEGCNVGSDGSVPKWALDEINSRFDNGILVV